MVHIVGCGGTQDVKCSTLAEQHPKALTTFAAPTYLRKRTHTRAVHLKKAWHRKNFVRGQIPPLPRSVSCCLLVSFVFFEAFGESERAEQNDQSFVSYSLRWMV
jgi:hypothetical protein